MRKWHRWTAVVFGLFLLWISATGVLSQIGSLVNKGGFAQSESARPAPPPGFVCPETMTCRPEQPPNAWNVGLLHHLHSGEQFGPVGVVISMLSGLALFFFAVSGLWMYFELWRGRLVRPGSRKLFW